MRIAWMAASGLTSMAPRLLLPPPVYLPCPQSQYLGWSHTAQSKALDDQHWDCRFRKLSLDVIRKVFRETYKKPYNGRTLSQMNEKERIIRFIEDFARRLPTTDHKRENLWRVQDIQSELSKHLKASDVPNLTVLGKALKNLKWPRGGNTGVRGYYLVLREEK